MWVTGFLRGFKVSFTIELRDNALGHDAISALDALVGVGFVAIEADMQAGEEKAHITHVIRLEHVGKEGEVTPALSMWDERGKFQQLKAYLNTPEQIKEFEAASGILLLDLPLYDGDATSFERTSPKSANAMKKLTKLPFAIAAYYTTYEGKNDKGEPQTRKRYTRCQRVAGATQNAAPAVQAETPRNPEPPQATPEQKQTAMRVRVSAIEHTINPQSGGKAFWRLHLGANDKGLKTVNYFGNKELREVGIDPETVALHQTLHSEKSTAPQHDGDTTYSHNIYALIVAKPPNAKGQVFWDVVGLEASESETPAWYTPDNVDKLIASVMKACETSPEVARDVFTRINPTTFATGKEAAAAAVALFESEIPF